MEKGKIIVIAGTDTSGKETQTELLYKRLINEKTPIYKSSFPRYDTPSGRIIAGPYLGKPEYSETWFKEGPALVDPLVAAPLFASDRRYNIPEILEKLDNGTNVLLDRYVSANLGHQGGKISDEKERLNMFMKLEILEYGISNRSLIDKLYKVAESNFSLNELELLKEVFDVVKYGVTGIPRPDQVIFLYMPYEYAKKLKEGRKEAPDGHESSEQHLRDAEAAYLQLASLNNWTMVNCVEDGRILTPSEIHEKVYDACLLKNSKKMSFSQVNKKSNSKEVR